MEIIEADAVKNEWASSPENHHSSLESPWLMEGFEVEGENVLLGQEIQGVARS